MILYPAIDLKDGQCVRLLRGDMDQATVFNDSPGDQARQFQDAGCRWLHVVDLNGAFAGRPVNADAVRDIRQAVDLKIQLGGGIRDMDTIAMWLDAGIDRVILGTVALRNPDLVKDACKQFPDRIAVGIDARNGRVAVEGWAEGTEITAHELGRRFEGAGVSVIIHTDIGRDGAMEGPNLDATRGLAERVSIPIVLSGGVSSMDDIRNAKDNAPMLNGVISGRALYDGRIDLAEAVKILEA